MWCLPTVLTTSALPYTAGSTKYFGTAKVRYDFCARDRSELNLKEGDIVKILNKKGQQGWWRGEIYGRVSQGGAWHLRHPGYSEAVLELGPGAAGEWLMGGLTWLRGVRDIEVSFVDATCI